jgi:hypothetical protein
MVHQFTDSQPMELPTVQMSQAEIDQVKQRFDAFEKAVREQRAAEPLVLSADDVNALIANGSGRESMKGKLYVSLEGGQVKGQLSLPLQEVGLSLFKGRYLNGTATFDLSFTNGVLCVAAQNIEVKGKPVPETFMQEFRKQNLAAGFAQQPAIASALQGLEEIRVSDGKLVVVPKEKQ